MGAKYQKVADDLLKKILTNEYPVGSAIPPENTLSKSYNVSRQTIRQSISLLVREGYLKAERGSGTFVQNYRIDSTNRPVKTIGVITTYLSDYIFPSIIEGIEEELRNNGYSLLISATNNDPYQEKLCLEKMLSQGVSGLLIEPTSSNEYNTNIAYYSRIIEQAIPIYCFNAYYELLDFPYASVDDTLASYEATRYLMKCGHKKIGIITKIDDIQGKLRMRGFVKAHKETGMRFYEEYLSSFTTTSQETIAKDYLNTIKTLDEKPTAIICYNDQIAGQLIRVMREEETNYLEDISLISFDNSYLAEAHNLTSVRHPKKQLGRDIVKQIIKNIETGEEMQTIVYPVEIEGRASVKKLK